MEAVPQTVEEIFADFIGRRNGLLKALTSEARELLLQYDPEEPKELYLYGSAEETWEIVAEPRPNITYRLALNSVEVAQGEDWISKVGICGQKWLVSVASYFASHFDVRERTRLMKMIKEFPSLSEDVKKDVEKKRKVDGEDVERRDPVCEICTTSWLEEEKERKRKNEEEKERKRKIEEERKKNDIGGVRSKRGKEREEDENYPLRIWIRCDKCQKDFHIECIHVSEDDSMCMVQFKCRFCLPRGKNSIIFLPPPEEGVL